MRTSRLSRVAFLLAPLLGLPSPQLAFAQPAPVTVTEIIVKRAAATEAAIPESSQNAILEAYRQAAGQMEWPVPENLQVASIRSYNIPDGVASQVLFGAQQIPDNAVLFITSENPEVFQRMTQADLKNYDGKSAYFRPGKLVIALITPPGAEAAPVDVERIRVLGSQAEGARVMPLAPPRSLNELRRRAAPDGAPESIGDNAPQPENLCGPDDRVASSDRRIGRLMPVGCTGWLIQNDLGLSAGHCTFSMDILEFQVPTSSASGNTQPAHVNDQYPIIKTSMVARDAGPGGDWVVFSIGPNSNTGKLPGEAQGGHFKLSRMARPDAVIVTGYGTDSSPPGATGGRNNANQTQQIENGKGSAPPIATFHDNGPKDSLFRYNVDTEGGNSGSPVIDATNDATAVGIHTHAGCGSGGNQGTAASNSDLEAAIKSFVGDLTKVYID